MKNLTKLHGNRNETKSRLKQKFALLADLITKYNMKTFKLIIVGITMLATNAMKAQVSVNVNIGAPPPWGPVGYSEERYYYLPDVEAYYDVQFSSFIYYEENVWVHRTYLPRRYRYYDLYSGYKVVIINYRGDSPYDNFKEYKIKYAKGYRGAPQKTIGVKPGKYSNKKTYSTNHSAKQKNKPSGGNKESGKGKSNPQGHGGGNGKKK